MDIIFQVRGGLAEAMGAARHHDQQGNDVKLRCNAHASPEARARDALHSIAHCCRAEKLHDDVIIRRGSRNLCGRTAFLPNGTFFSCIVQGLILGTELRMCDDR